MKPLPIGTQTFEKLIETNCVYVDKTPHILQLLNAPIGLFFLSRPRRFGKSLLLSTIKAIFQGRSELFEGLAIAQSGYGWPVHPVIHLDMSGSPMHSPADLDRYLVRELGLIAGEYGVELAEEGAPDRLVELIRELAQIGKVVILIDEYDKPILDHIETPAAVAMKDALADFYGVIKPNEEHTRFVLLTGVTKFSKVSVFSKLNNLDDLTMARDCADLLGYTQEELESNFQEHLAVAARDTGLRHEELLEQIQHWYNGYRFSKRDVKVYNPMSTMLMLKNRDFGGHWFQTGTPGFLLDVIALRDYDLRGIEELMVDEEAFSTFDVDDLRVEPLLFQTGYLTVTDYDPGSMLFTLGYPNFEVKNAFLRHLADRFSSVSKELAAGILNKMIAALKAKDLASFFELLRSFFAGIDYDLHLKHEKYYQTIFYLVFRMIGLQIDAEVKTSRGRADAVVQTDSEVFIFEFKLFDTKESALAQIRETGYHDKYSSLGKAIHLIGVEFNVEERNLGGWVEEVIPAKA